MPSNLRVLYLHGFASSPLSRKAQFFGEKFKELGIPFEAPDLAAGDFFHLTLSGQLGVIDAAVASRPVVLMGSSLGGYLAALYAAEHRLVERLILLAPAFGFHDLWTERLGSDGIAHWRETGSLSVFHYGRGGEAQLSYQFLLDARGYPPYPYCSQPALIFHGRQDDLVPFRNSIQFANQNPQAELKLVDSGHELTDALDEVWCELRPYLGICEPPPR